MENRMEKLTGQVIVITDGGSPEGAEIALHLGRAGATLVLYDEDAKRTDQAAADIRHDWGTTAVQIGYPFGDDHSKLIDDVLRTCGGFDGLVLMQRDSGVATGLLAAAQSHMAAREHGLVVVAGATSDRPRIGKLEESLGSCRRCLDANNSGAIRTYGVCGLQASTSLGPAVTHLAETRPDGEMDGRVLVVPPTS